MGYARRAGVVTIGVVAIDQLAKAVVRARIAPGEDVPVIGTNTLHLVNARNSGIAGGLLAGQSTALIIAVSAVALVSLLWIATRLAPRGGLAWLPVGMVLGGGLSNLLDRLTTGAVTDWIVRGHSGPMNLADQAITLGIVILLVLVWRGDRAQHRAQAQPAPSAPLQR
jgi:signal peptidase II